MVCADHQRLFVSLRSHTLITKRLRDIGSTLNDDSNSSSTNDDEDFNEKEAALNLSTFNLGVSTSNRGMDAEPFQTTRDSDPS